jgi:hypothetical protein
MAAWQRWAVCAVVATIVGGHLVDIATGVEHWPFSPYPMYSRAQSDWAPVMAEIVGVRLDGEELAVKRPELLAPFDQARLLGALARLGTRPDGTALVRTALVDCLSRYERRRRQGAHDGPVLRALRLYHSRYVLDVAASTVGSPASRTLVLEVTDADTRQ